MGCLFFISLMQEDSSHSAGLLIVRDKASKPDAKGRGGKNLEGLGVD